METRTTSTDQVMAGVKATLMDTMNARDVAMLPRSIQKRFFEIVRTLCVGAEQAGKLLETHAKRSAQSEAPEREDWRMRQIAEGDR